MLNPFTPWTPGVEVTYHGSLTSLHGTYRARPCPCLNCDDPGLGTTYFRLVTADGATAVTCVRPRSITPTTALNDCRACKGDGAHPECNGTGCPGCDPTTGNCPTCAGTGNDPERWQRSRA